MSIVLVRLGAQVNLYLAWGTGLVGLAIIGCGLIIRSIAANLSTRSYGINRKQGAFGLACNLPKATVPAALAAIPMEAGVMGGDII